LKPSSVILAAKIIPSNTIEFMKAFIFSAVILLASCAPQAPQTPSAQEAQAPSKDVIASPDAPEAIGPYSQAIRVSDTVWLAGQISLDPVTGGMITGSIEIETRQVMANIEAVLEAAGLELKDVVQTQVYLTDLNEYQTFNAVYAEYFPTNPPARAVVQVSRLPRDAKVEIMMTAHRTR
jgi:2-iminobutanoate/2-iminopropanoate deaminase